MTEPLHEAMWNEPGRWVDSLGIVRYAWPPEGRFKTLWDALVEVTTEEERDALAALIRLEQDDNSTLIAYTREDGEWVDVEPRWNEVENWLGGGPQ